MSWVTTVGADGRTFGARLHDLIIDSGKTAKQIAAETGIKESSLSDYRRGKNNRVPDSEAIRVLANYFHVSYEYLYGEVRAAEKENIVVSQLYGLDDNAARLLRNMQTTEGNNSDEYTQRMIVLFNELFSHGFGDLLLRAVMLDMDMERLAADNASEEETEISAIVGNRHKDRPKGMALIPQEDFYKQEMQKLAQSFESLLKQAMRSSVEKA